MSMLNMEMNTWIAYITNARESDMPVTKATVLQTFCVPVFIYAFWNYLQCTAVFPGLPALTVMAYFNFG